MKRTFFILISAALLSSGCMKDSVKEQYTFFRPVYSTRDEVKNNIKSNVATGIQQPGKIVVKDHYLFLNEVDKGIHVIDIANPAKPVNLAFIEIPGCVDLAINGNHLYADCYTDLVTLDISDPTNVITKQFLGGVFPNRYYQGFVADTSKVIRTWVRVDTVVSSRFTGSFSFGVLANSPVFMSFSASSLATVSSSGISIAGSLARFGLQNNRLYTVSNDDMKVFNTVTPSSPSYITTLALRDGNIETIFPYKNKLFIGARAGMFVYDASNPDLPVKSSAFTHARSCDPVIVDDSYAYVTLSGGSLCGGYTNQLDVVNISNLANPSLVKSYTLSSPKGLSKDGNLLLICDGKDGLKIFNAANASQVSLIKQVPGFEASDVISLQGTAIAVAKDGIYFINYTDPLNASVISKISINQN